MESNGLDVWWSHDGQDDLSTESTQLPAVDVADNSVVEGITVTVQANENAVYGEYSVSLKCRDKENSDCFFCGLGPWLYCCSIYQH